MGCQNCEHEPTQGVAQPQVAGLGRTRPEALVQVLQKRRVAAPPRRVLTALELPEEINSPG